MKQIRILTFSMLAILLVSFKPLTVALQEQPAYKQFVPPAAKVNWVNDTHDFGEIPRSVAVSVEFAFTNTGDAALIISDVITSCGCTASEYTREPIMPGKSSKIKVSYNAANPGAFSKTITVNSNDQQPAKILTIKGVVK